MTNEGTCRIRASKRTRFADPDPNLLEAGSGSAKRVKSWIRIRIKVKMQKLKRLKTEPWKLTKYALRI